MTAEARDRKLGYFENNAHRMRYARFRSLGMFIGSGAVEAGCKAAPGAAPEAVWHEMVPGRGDRDPHPALPGSLRSLGRDLAAAAQPSRSGLTPHLTTARTQTIKVSPGYPRVTYKSRLTRILARVPRMSVVARTFAESILDMNRRRVLDACP